MRLNMDSPFSCVDSMANILRAVNWSSRNWVMGIGEIRSKALNSRSIWTAHCWNDSILDERKQGQGRGTGRHQDQKIINSHSFIRIHMHSSHLHSKSHSWPFPCMMYVSQSVEWTDLITLNSIIHLTYIGKPRSVLSNGLKTSMALQFNIEFNTRPPHSQSHTMDTGQRWWDLEEYGPIKIPIKSDRPGIHIIKSI